MRYYRVYNSEQEYRINGNKISERPNRNVPWSEEIQVDERYFDYNMLWLVEQNILVEFKEYDCPDGQ